MTRRVWLRLLGLVPFALTAQARVRSITPDNFDAAGKQRKSLAEA